MTDIEIRKCAGHFGKEEWIRNAFGSADDSWPKAPKELVDYVQKIYGQQGSDVVVGHCIRKSDGKLLLTNLLKGRNDSKNPEWFLAKEGVEYWILKQSLTKKQINDELEEYKNALKRNAEK